MLKFEAFYRANGIRLLAQMMTPAPQQFQRLPENIIFHYLPIDNQPKEPMLREAWLQPFLERDYVVEAVSDYYPGATGYTRKANIAKQALLRPWIKDHPKSKQAVRPLVEMLTSPVQLGLVNYGYLRDVYQYPTTQLAILQEFNNRVSTMWNNIVELTTKTDRQHFLKLRAPDRVYSFKELELYSATELRLGARKLFPDEASLMILDFWRWLDAYDKPKTAAEIENPRVGVGRSMSMLGRVPVKALSKINVVWELTNGMCVVTNLGYINSWIKHQVNQTDQKNPRQLTSLEMKKMFWKFLQGIGAQRTITDEVVAEVSAQSTKDPATGAPLTKPLAEGGVAKKPGMVLGAPNSTASALDPTSSDEDLDLGTDVDSIDEEIRTEDELAAAREVNIEEITDLDQATSFARAKSRLTERVDPQLRLMERVDALVQKGAITAAVYKSIRKNIDEHPNRPDPYGKFKTRREAADIKLEELMVDHTKSRLVGTAVVGKETQAYSSLRAVQQGYVKQFMSRDMVSVIDHLQAGGLVIQSHEVQHTTSLLGEAEVHTLQVRMVPGEPETIRFTIPKVDRNCYFMVNGVRYRQRTQRADVPLRKISSDIVSIKSYTGTIQVTRNNRVSNQAGEWIIKQIFVRSIGEQALVRGLRSMDVFDNEFKSPYIYGIISSRYSEFTVRKNRLVFDHTQRATMGFDLKSLEVKGRVLCGVASDKSPIVMTPKGELLVVRPTGEESLGDMYTFLQLNPSEAPLDYAENSVFGRSVPTGVTLGYYLGIDNFIKLLNVKHRWVDGRKKKELTPYEFSIPFADGSLVVDRRDRHASMVLAGLLKVGKTTRAFPYKEFNHPDVYFNALQELGLNQIYLKEMDRALDLFIDPITRQNLELMKEPTTFPALLIRAVELLDTYHYPTSQDARYQVFRGYERFAGIVYQTLVKGMAQQQSKSTTGRAKISISPYAVKQKIQEDASLAPANEINPLQSIKEQEIVTYGGTHGRSKDGMNRASRAFHDSDLGVVSLEGSVDSGDVGVNFFMSANPQLANVRGFINPGTKPDHGNLLSTAGAVAPFVTQDDMKRAVFVGVQAAHVIAAEGYTQSPIRTGAEIQVTSRAGPMFANHADDDGVVESVGPKGVIVRYKDGSSEGFKVGRSFGNSEGSVYPHDLISAVTVGQKVVGGQVITYNPAFFEVDILDPKNITTRNGKLVTVQFIESAETHEDSAAISEQLSKDFTTKNTKVVSVPVAFDERIHAMVKVGDRVEPGQYLLLIESSGTANSDSYDEASLKTLANMSKKAPETPIGGVVDRIEFNYHGSKEDMNVSLKQLADVCDRARVDEARAVGKKTTAGAFDSEYRVAGEPLLVDNAEIKIYITQELGLVNADKIVLASQLKGTVGQVMPRTVTTEYGDPVDVAWSYRSVAGRIVESPILMGTGIVLLKLASVHMAKIYERTAK